LFGGSLRRKSELLSIFPDAKIFPIPPTFADLLWNKLHILPVEKLIGKVEVLHTSDWSEPPSSAFKVTTVHDLAPFLYPSLFPRDILRNIVDTHRLRLAHVRNESDRIIVPTEATKSDLLKLGFSVEKIRVIPEAASSIFKRVDSYEIDRIKKKYKIHGPYLLSVGMDPRKNTERIIKAFEQAKAGKNMKLIFVGQPKYVKTAETRNIRILGNVVLEDLPALYSGAGALVYPSLYEGFGLPILEAMACGCPVITSNTSSMAEVAGNAALLVDPTDIESIKLGIEKVMRGAKSLSDKGYKRVLEFSWKKTAEETLKVYEEAGR
jgi:glycosyltransferase involved in cell wall biosynthesis